MSQRIPYKIFNDKILNLPPMRLEWLVEEMKESNDYKSVYHLPLLSIYKSHNSLKLKEKILFFFYSLLIQVILYLHTYVSSGPQ